MSAIETSPQSSESQLSGSLDPRTIRMVGGMGLALDGIAYACTEATRGGVGAPDLSGLLSGHLAGFPHEDDASTRPFAVGASDACQALALRFGGAVLQQSVRGALAPASRERLGSRESAWCGKVSVDLAGYQFPEALMRLAREKYAVTSAQGRREYREGIHFAVKRAVSGYRGVLERRTRRFLAIEDPTSEQLSATVMLFVAVTGTTFDRVRQDLGVRFVDVLQQLDDEKFIRCADGRPKPALLLTADGATLLRNLVVKNQPADITSVPAISS